MKLGGGVRPEMQVQAPATRRADGAVPGVLNYQHRHVELIRSRRDTGGSDDALQGADWDARTVLVRDGRNNNKIALDTHGFELLADPKAPHADYYDEQAVVTRYYRECEELLQRATGASRVFAFDHNVRCDLGKATGRRLVGGTRRRWIRLHRRPIRHGREGQRRQRAPRVR